MEKYMLRVKKIELTSEWLTDAIKGDLKPFTTNIPADAFIFGIEWDYLRNRITLLVASKEFEPVNEGSIPPTFIVTCQTKE